MDDKERDLSALHRNLRTLENIIDSIDEAVIACNQEGRVIVYNRASERLEGRSRHAVLGRLLTDAYLLSEENSLLIRAMKEKRPIIDQYQSYTTSTGTRINIMCSTVPLFDESAGVMGAVSIMKDYSRVEQLSEKIIELQEQLNRKRGQNRTRLRDTRNVRYTFKDIVGSSSCILRLVSSAKRAAASSSPILIYGETGTGKELLAQSIHHASPRRFGPFIAYNCAAIPENLLEGILFGTVKGAFTGAVDRPGLFEQATGGTLLLDEINSMPLNLQAKLLRVLQEGSVRRVGDTQEITVDVRIISNTSVPPQDAIRQGKMRDDLYYRIGVVCLEIPPLRNRREDIPELVQFFVSNYNQVLNRNIMNVSDQVLQFFTDYHWPGNIRELAHVIESSMNMVSAEDVELKLHHLPQHYLSQAGPASEQAGSGELSRLTLERTMERAEATLIRQALDRNKGNVTQTAKELGLLRQSLQYRMRKYNIRGYDPLP